MRKLPNLTLKTICQASLLSIGVMSASVAHSASFQLNEQSVSGLGRAFAGSGVAGDNALDSFFNPASMSLLSESSVSVAGYYVQLDGEFVNQGSNIRVGQTVIPAQGTTDGGVEDSPVANFALNYILNDRLSLGLHVGPSFGLPSTYDDTFIGRFNALESELTVIDITPSISYKASEQFSIGGGIIFQYADAKLSQAQFTGPTTPAGLSTVEGDDSSIGFSLGAIWHTDALRLGLGYRSEVDQDIEGNLTIAPLGVDVPAQTSVSLPETFWLSLATDINENVELLATIRQTNWSSLQELVITNSGGLPTSVIPFDYTDSTSYHIGANYDLNDTWQIRGGLAYEESPIDDSNRTARIPDGDRTWLAFGATKKIGSNITIDFAYSRVFTDDLAVDQTVDLVATQPGAASSTLRGTFEDTGSNIFGIQFNYSF